jgi:uncharacterized protein (TIGR02266 family)
MPSPVTLKIKFKSGSLQQFIERYSVDVSKGGIFIRTPKPLAVGTALKFEFQLQDGAPLLNGNGTVVWIREADPDKSGVAPGMGVRFDLLPPDSQRVLDQVLAQKQQAMEFSDQPTRVAAPTDLDEAAHAPEPTPAAAPVAMMRPITEHEKETSAKLDAIPEPAPKPFEPAPRPAPAPKAAEPEEESEAARKDRLAKILFSSDDVAAEGRMPTEAELAAAAASKPIPEERKSSALVWVLILLLIAGGIALYWFFLREPPKTTTAPKADIVETKVEPQKDVAPPPASKPAGVTMKVTSEPAGAKIIVDGKDTGKVTPADIEGLDAEKEVEVKLDLPGKKLFSTKVKPTAETPVEAKLDKPSSRIVKLTSEPAGAMVSIGGVRVGKTPVDYKRPLKGKVEVLFRLDGYKDLKKEITGEEAWTREGEDEVLTIPATLEKKEAAPAPQPKPKLIKRVPKPKPQPDIKVDTEPKDDTDKPEPKPKKKPEKPDEPKDDGDPDAKKGAVKKPSWME